MQGIAPCFFLMKLKRFVAPDMRAALTMIKEDLGDDAVIMSNKRLADGVEIVAGIEEQAVRPASGGPRRPRQPLLRGTAAAKRELKDDEVTLSGVASGSAAVSAAPASGAGAGSKAKAESFAKSLIEILQRQKERSERAAADARPPEIEEQEPVWFSPDDESLEEEVERDTSKAKSRFQLQAQANDNAQSSRRAPAPLAEQSGLRDLFEEKEKQRLREREKNQRLDEIEHGMRSYVTPGGGGGDTLVQMRQEVDAIRRLLQFELAGLIRESEVREQPVKAMITELLISAGFCIDVAKELCRDLDLDASFHLAWRQLAEILESRLAVGEDEIMNEGGVVALIGPAGVGKTTTIAKLAARFVMNYGPDKVALITADHYRIGAADQVKTYGRIMGCSAYSVKSMDELPELLYSLKNKSLVLLDTAGVGLKDQRFGIQLAELKKQSKLKIKNYLVLPATTQSRVLEQAYAHFADTGLAGIILTKTDESQSLGDALSLCIKHNIKLCYVTNGQRVPEDLCVPVARKLVQQALSAVENDATRAASDSDNKGKGPHKK